MRDLQVFRGLGILRIEDRDFFNCNRTMSERNPSIPILRRLVRESRYFPSLETIRITSWIHKIDFRCFSDPATDVDEICGWAYSVEKVEKQEPSRKTRNCEILQRMHGPHRLETSKLSEGSSDK